MVFVCYRDFSVLCYKFSVRARQRLSLGTGAVMLIGSLLTGCMNSMLRACSDMPPSGLERGAPYFKSPLIGHPIDAN